MPELIYPEPPQHDGSNRRTSAAFKKQVIKVTAAIIFFIILYALLLVLGLGLAGALGYTGVMVIFYVHNYIAIAFGIGLLGIGLMVAFFLVKFVFATKKDDVDAREEISEEDYPELFDFVRKVSAETKTHFPKHIYLTAEVNASVSYDSSLKSLIFPARKNLTIGLGLVNMVNTSEFKAVLAHEFGHFSQDSMRAGSYVYQVNRVIYNLLFDNNDYAAVLDIRADVHRIFALCAGITIKIVQSIQWVLQQAYKVINTSYMGLSRQMEFHADAIAAGTAGSNNMIHALRRIEFGSAAYDATINRYSNLYPEHYKAKNVFRQQVLVAQFLARVNDLQSFEGLPLLHDMDKLSISYRRVTVEDQWASHPSRTQRETALVNLNITGRVYETSPWQLFGDRATELQERFTKQIYAQVVFTAPEKELTDDVLGDILEGEVSKFTYPDVYQAYYDGRSIVPLDKPTPNPERIPDVSSFFGNNNNLIKRIEALSADIKLLEQVADKKNRIRYFDIDGQKMRRKDALVNRDALAVEKERLERQLEKNDAMVYAHFHACAIAANKGEAYLALYRQFEENIKVINTLVASAETVLEKINMAYTENRSQEGARALSGEIRKALDRLQAELVATIDTTGLQGLVQVCGMPATVEAIRSNRSTFFSARSYNNEALQKTWEGTVALINWCFDLKFYVQKDLAVGQLQYTEASAGVANAAAVGDSYNTN